MKPGQHDDPPLLSRGRSTPSRSRAPNRDKSRADPALDEELEIPAFLRRQINPR